MCFLLVGTAEVLAQRFVYTPRDPRTASRDQFGLGRDPLNDFSESLNRQILSRLSREILERQFGEESLESGTYNLGDYQIDIRNSGSGLVVTIVDNVTGATSTIEVPFF